MQKLKSGFKLTATLGLAVSSLFGFISDFLYPIAPFAIYLFLLSISIFAISVFVRFIPKFNNYIETSIPDYWYLPVAATLIVSSAVFLFSYNLSNERSDEGGFLASEFGIFERMQQDIGLISEQIRDLNDTAEKIEINTASTARNTKETSEKLDNVKKEVSSNPRKELKNLGVDWNREEFGRAISNLDMYLIELFVQGGMDPSRAKSADFDFGNAVAYLMREQEPGKEVLNYLLREGGLDIDASIPHMGSLMHNATNRMYSNPEQAIDWLIENGAYINVKKSVSTVRYYNRLGSGYLSWDETTPLCLAEFEMARANANLKIGNYKDEWEKMHSEALKEYKDIAEHLKQRGAKSSGTISDWLNIPYDYGSGHSGVHGCPTTIQCPIRNLSEYDEYKEVCSRD